MGVICIIQKTKGTSVVCHQKVGVIFFLWRASHPTGSPGFWEVSPHPHPEVAFWPWRMDLGPEWEARSPGLWPWAEGSPDRHLVIPKMKDLKSLIITLFFFTSWWIKRPNSALHRPRSSSTIWVSVSRLLSLTPILGPRWPEGFPSFVLPQLPWELSIPTFTLISTQWSTTCPIYSPPHPGEGNGNSLQYSCLESPMDGGARWAAVHGVTKSRTRLSDFPSSKKPSMRVWPQRNFLLVLSGHVTCRLPSHLWLLPFNLPQPQSVGCRFE